MRLQGGDIKERLLWWDKNVFPVYSKAPEPFKKWTDFCLPYVVSYKLNKFPLSDISFSVLDSGRTINSGRLAVGVFLSRIKDRKKLYEMYNETVEKLIGNTQTMRVPERLLVLVGIGIDLPENEVKTYLYLKHNEKPIILGYTYKNGKLIERKVYYPKRYGYIGRGKRGERKQIDVELCGQRAKKVINRLPLQEETKTLASKIIDAGFCLDTVSLSKKRGTVLYFD